MDMITVNLLQPKVAFPLYLLSDLPQVSHSRSFAQPAPKIKFPGVQSSSPSPRLREFLLGKSPLRLVVKRTWHTQDSFTDVLECGHESQLQFTAFGYVEDQYLYRIQPTAKRRRCQECKENQREAISADRNCLSGVLAASRVSRPAVHVVVPSASRVADVQVRDSSPVANLYDSCREILNSPPKKSPKRAA